MKRRKNKAVMSWLVRLHTLLIFLRCTPCLSASCRQPLTQLSFLHQSCTIPTFPLCPYLSASQLHMPLIDLPRALQKCNVARLGSAAPGAKACREGPYRHFSLSADAADEHVGSMWQGFQEA